jgi:hypothetical protein
VADFEIRSHLNYHPLISEHHTAIMFRTMAMLAVVVSADLYLFGGKYAAGTWPLRHPNSSERCRPPQLAACLIS